MIPIPGTLLVLRSREKAEEEPHLPLYGKWPGAQCEENGSRGVMCGGKRPWARDRIEVGKRELRDRGSNSAGV